MQAAGEYVRIHVEGRQHLVERSLGQMEQPLETRGFARIHRSLLVSLAPIRELVPLGSSRCGAVLESGARLPVSRSRFAELRRRFL